MKINTIDLKHELRKLKENEKPQIIEEVKEILQSQALREAIIEKRILEGSRTFDYNLADFKEENIYTIDQIKKLCVKYRLRFLDSKVFAGEIPYEAISKIKALEEELGQSLSGFKIVAPKELFQLEDKDSDPLLFLQLSENKFYFIHKWGGELNRFRSILATPMRSFMSMFWFLAAVALIFTILIPTKSFDVSAFLFVHSFIAICGITCLLVFTFRENFSDVEWNSRFFS